MNFSAADKFCAEHGGHLGSIHTALQNSFVYAQRNVLMDNSNKLKCSFFMNISKTFNQYTYYRGRLDWLP